jgi:hypothetical protein
LKYKATKSFILLVKKCFGIEKDFVNFVLKDCSTMEKQTEQKLGGSEKVAKEYVWFFCTLMKSLCVCGYIGCNLKVI